MTEKLNMHTKDFASVNAEKLALLFPECVTEVSDVDGGLRQVIDFDKLKQILSSDIIDGQVDRYQFTWPDKKSALRIANTPTNMTLRPCREESVNFDTTENLYIEGDNLEVLKLLREDYLGKVKMIYIDPPYNTGNDFIYEDDFSLSSSDYWDISGQSNEDGNRLFQNTESNGRFHTDWLNMIYPRLRVARDLLTEDGVIFISIGEAEIDNMIKIADEIYGASNRIGVVPRVMKSGGGKGQFFSPNIDYLVIYGKAVSEKDCFREPISEEIINRLYTSVETVGPRKGERYRPFGLYQSSLDPLRGCSNQRYFIEAPDGSLLLPPGNAIPVDKQDGGMVSPKSRDDKVWRWTRDRYLQEKAQGNIEFKKSDGVLIDSNGNPARWNVYTKIWLSERQEEGMTPVNFITKYENRHSAKELKQLNIPFDFAKPIGLISYLACLCSTCSGDIVLDFFSGSATTAHAIMQLNAEDGCTRKFIMVQLPEQTDEKSEAFKSGFKNICEIGKERIRRAGKKLLEQPFKNETSGDLFTQTESNPKVDIGFRVLKLDTSNMQDVYYRPEESNETTLFKDNIKPDRTPEDLLFQVMLECNLPLSAKIETKKIEGKDVFSVNKGYLIACFDTDVNEDVIKAVAKMKPYYFIMRDSSLSSDNVADNFDQIFQAYSKETIRRVL